MSKLIKFNLALDGVQVRTLDELRDHFNVDDLLELYEQGILQRWLTVRGYEREAKALTQPEADDFRRIEKMAKVFGVEWTRGSLHEQVWATKLLRTRFAREQEQKVASATMDDFAKRYHRGFDELKEEMVDNCLDFPRIKATVAELEARYLKLFLYNVGGAFSWAREKCPLAIVAMLMRPALREAILMRETARTQFEQMLEPLLGRYLSTVERTDPASIAARLALAAKLVADYKASKLVSGVTTVRRDTDRAWLTLEPATRNFVILRLEGSSQVAVSHAQGSTDSAWTAVNAVGKICSGIRFRSNMRDDCLVYAELAIKSEPVPWVDQLVGHVRCVRGATDSFYSPKEPKGAKVLVLSIPEGSYVVSAVDRTWEFGPKEIEGTYPILDGLEYKSRNGDEPLLYLRVDA